MEIKFPWQTLHWNDGLVLDNYPSYNPSWEGWKEVSHDELNQLKTQIDPLEENGTWEYRKKLANPFELVYTQDEKKTPLCLATAKPLSRSYFKMIEMLSITHFFKKLGKVRNYRTTHVCEGPGGFIQAFCEQANKNLKNVDICLAMTLRPTQAHIPGWKRAAHFLRNYPQVKITYGADNSGDIYNLENQQYFFKEIGEQKSHLFTADGGFDFKSDYIHQEQTAFRLIVASFAMAFESLQPGGVCIIKLFDTFGNATQELLGYVSCYFKQWMLYKPAMSRPCNSERYFIGTGFRGSNDASKDFFLRLQKDLSEHQISDLESLFKDIPFEKSINSIQQFSQEVEQRQIQVLTNAIQADVDKPWLYWKVAYEASEQWCKAFPIQWRQVIAKV